VPCPLGFLRESRVNDDEDKQHTRVRAARSGQVILGLEFSPENGASDDHDHHHIMIANTRLRRVILVVAFLAPRLIRRHC
jgi:hypothetical protein